MQAVVAVARDIEDENWDRKFYSVGQMVWYRKLSGIWVRAEVKEASHPSYTIWLENHAFGIRFTSAKHLRPSSWSPIHC